MRDAGVLRAVTSASCLVPGASFKETKQIRQTVFEERTHM